MTPFNVIVCTDNRNGISRNVNGKDIIPWSLPNETKQFWATVSGSIIIMGRNTFKAIGIKKIRANKCIAYVISNTLTDAYNANQLHHSISTDEFIERYVYYFRTFTDALGGVVSGCIPFVIGGEQLYREAIFNYIDNCKELHISTIDKNYNCDKFFPNVDISHFNVVSSNIFDATYETKVLVNSTVNRDESNYQRLLKKILSNGVNSSDRTGVGTRRITGESLKFNCRNWRLPLLTTKRMPINSIIEELLFFMRGDTDATILSSKGVKIWNGNSTREYLDSIGLNHYNVGELGAVYGYQWRFWNKPYVPFNQRIEESCNEFCINGHTHDHANETLNEGIDQLAQCIDMIRNNPTSRRILFHSWNPEQLHEMALPPCHILYSFTVNTVTNELNCTMFQRSADCFLGLPFNIASTAILLMTMCKLTDTVPGDITIAINDAHIYLNHIEQVNTQLERTPYRFPSMTIKEFTNNNDITVIDTLTSADYTLNNYVCHPTIKADMAV